MNTVCISTKMSTPKKQGTCPPVDPTDLRP